jgi:hypothetical protein
VDPTGIVSEFIDELLGLHSAYAITDIGALDAPDNAAAFVRLRVRLCEALIADGWAPSPEAALQLERDRLLVLEADDAENITVAPSELEDRAALRARAQRVRSDARETSERAGAQRRERDDAREEIEQMRQALASRAVIEQAKGIAMERYGLRAEVAWAWLVRTSQNRNVKLRAIAEELVTSVAGGAEPEGGTQPESGTPEGGAQSEGGAADKVKSSATSMPSA